MKVAIYGISGSGKDYLISQLKDVKHIKGSEWLNQKSNNNFRDLPEHEKTILRGEFVDFINRQEAGNIVVDGHYAFPNGQGDHEVVFTEYDGGSYDTFVYLDTPSSEINKRIQKSEKNKRYRSLGLQEINAWKNFELEGLRQECLKRNKDLFIFDDDIASCVVYFNLILNGASSAISYAAAEEIVPEIITKSSGKDIICLLDCDNTLASNDITYEFLKFTQIDSSIFRKTFGDNRYSPYQFWKIASIYSKIKEYDQYCMMAAKQATLNQALIDDVKSIPGCYFVGVTSGLYKSWKTIMQSCGFPDMIVGGSNTATDKWLVSAMMKGFIAKLLREQGKMVIAVGDSMGDRFMLEMADQGYVIAQGKRSSSLQKYLNTNQHSMKQPAHNKIIFDEVEKVRNIHEDLK